MERALGILFTAHSHWRQLVILIGIVVLAALLIGLLAGRWRRWHNALCLVAIAVLDIQVLMGLGLWVAGQRWLGQDPLRSWEHPVTMLLAAAAAHVGYARTKAFHYDSIKFRYALGGFVVAGLLVGLGLWRILAR